MRIFKKYAPMLIAKYVSAFFKGKFEIEGQGVFVFDNGLVVIEEKQNIQLKKIAKEINKLIFSLTGRTRTKNPQFLI